jgi:hypothetical protein
MSLEVAEALSSRRPVVSVFIHIYYFAFSVCLRGNMPFTQRNFERLDLTFSDIK